MLGKEGCSNQGASEDLFVHSSKQRLLHEILQPYHKWPVSDMQVTALSHRKCSSLWAPQQSAHVPLTSEDVEYFEGYMKSATLSLHTAYWV